MMQTVTTSHQDANFQITLKIDPSDDPDGWEVTRKVVKHLGETIKAAYVCAQVGMGFLSIEFVCSDDRVWAAWNDGMEEKEKAAKAARKRKRQRR